MPDPRFFQKSGSWTVEELAKHTGAVVKGDGNLTLQDVSPLDRATSADLSFLDNMKYKDTFLTSKAGACFVNENMIHLAPEGMTLLVTKTPYKAYALAARKFYPEPWPEACIADSAQIASDASIGKGCIIEEGAIVQSGAEIGEGSYIEANAVIGRHVVLGQGCRIGPNASVTHSILGDHVWVYPGARIGQDGFGFAIDPAGYVKVPQLGRVLIGDGVQVGANTTIDRGAGPDTMIGDGTWIDNLVQIGHNVRIGKGCIIVSQTGISGSTDIGDFVVMGGQSGITGHLKIGTGAKIAAKSGVMRDIPPGEEYMGAPAMPKKQFMRQIVSLERLANQRKS